MGKKNNATMKKKKRTWPYKFPWGTDYINLLVCYVTLLIYCCTLILEAVSKYCHFPCKFYSKMFSIHLINYIYSLVKNEKNI